MAGAASHDADQEKDGASSAAAGGNSAAHAAQHAAAQSDAKLRQTLEPEQRDPATEEAHVSATVQEPVQVRPAKRLVKYVCFAIGMHKYLSNFP